MGKCFGDDVQHILNIPLNQFGWTELNQCPYLAGVVFVVVVTTFVTCLVFTFLGLADLMCVTHTQLHHIHTDSMEWNAMEYLINMPLKNTQTHNRQTDERKNKCINTYHSCVEQ